MHRHQPRPRDALLRPIPEVALIARIRRDRAPVRPGLMALHRFRRAHVRRVLHHRHAVRKGRIVLRADHQPAHLVERITRLPSAVRPIGRVGVHIDVVAVVDPPVLRGLRIDMHLMLTDPRRPLVHAVWIAEVGFEHLNPVVHRPLAVHPVPGLRGDAVELIPLLPQRILMPPRFVPRQLHVPHVPVVVVHRRDRDAIVVRTDERVRTDDHVRQVRGALRILSGHDEVLAVLDGLRLDPVVLEPPRTRPHRL